ncbi:hypothetical protein [Nonomuraea salmonea]|uniref:RCC1-like domain-containing protein n=1 Tax=Nonomuraea salmonea TaxID=46181 RepID=A0ABV5P2L2_9ACTN
MATSGAFGERTRVVQERLCDQKVNDAGEVVESVSFLRRYQVTAEGAQVGAATDWQLDGRTPYETAGSIVTDCSSSAPAAAPEPCGGVESGSLEPEWEPVADPAGAETVSRTSPFMVTFDRQVSTTDTVVSVGGQPASLVPVAGTTYRVLMESPLPACAPATAEVLPVALNGCPDPAGKYVSAAVTARAEAQPAYAWGYNAYGRLGEGSTTGQTTPVEQKTGDLELVRIEGGVDAFSLGVDAAGQIWAWGYNGYGAFGDGTTTTSYEPVKSKMPPGVTAVDISASRYASAFVGSDGKVYTAGYGGYGQLGTGGTSSRSTWAPVPLSAAAVQVSCGNDHAIALLEDGTVWGWGYDGEGEASGQGVAGGNELTPVKATFPEGTVIREIAAGSYFNVAVDSAGKVWTWGIDNWQQLGNCDPDAVAKPLPAAITMPEGVTAAHVRAGYANGAFIATDGALWVWGSNVYGNCGQGTSGGTETCPVKVPLSAPVVDMEWGTDTAVALLDNGEVYAWGYGGSGEMGNGSTNAPNPTPLQVTALPDRDPTGVAVSDYSVFVTFSPKTC